MHAAPATILIVDDEPQNRKLLEALLRPEGYLTTSVSSGEAALASVAHAAPDLILLDVMMPGMDGNVVARMLKDDPETSPIPIIMVTAQNDRSARLAGLESGAEDFLTKPVDRGELWLRVRNLLRLKEYAAFLRDHNQLLEQEVGQRSAELLRFRAAMDKTADAIMLISRASMQFIEANATACAMFGCQRDELLGTGPAKLMDRSSDELAATYDDLIGGVASAPLETEFIRRDGSRFEGELRWSAHRSGDEWIMVGVIRDLTERKLAEQRLHQLAHYDELTGLPNRLMFQKTLAQALALASANGGRLAIMVLDLDHFKNVNDRHGHVAGDELLRQVGHRLVQCLRTRDTIGWLGGDQFAFVLTMHDGQLGAALVADKIKQALLAPFMCAEQEVTFTASIGITVYPNDAGDPETLLQYADTAMYEAKQAGRDCARFFTSEMNAEMLRRLDLEAALRQAVDREEFVLHYQPKVQLKTGTIAGFEVLLRWERPGHGMVAPSEFIPVLQEMGLIVRVGTWVLERACAQIAAWIAGDIGPVPVAVNVASQQFTSGDLAAEVRCALAQSGIPPAFLELELTEGSLMENTATTIESLRSLKQMGLRISVDDFGTGYSSLAYLRRFPIDKVKIDIAFVRGIAVSADDESIALAIIRMAQSLKLEVIAEGVETQAQAAFLHKHGCDQIQGYIFSKPLPVAEVEKLLREQKNRAFAAAFPSSAPVDPGLDMPDAASRHS